MSYGNENSFYGYKFVESLKILENLKYSYLYVVYSVSSSGYGSLFSSNYEGLLIISYGYILVN